MRSNTSKITIVPLYIIILMVSIPQLSETVYVPSLPDLARDLLINDNLAEFTLSIYLFGFAIGVLIWGHLSDYYGRKPCLIVGFIIYAIACFICYLSYNIDLLLIARFIQAFGVSVGSVLGQAIARDTIKAEERGKMFSTVSIAMAFAPALGPIIGGFIVKYYHWSIIFLVLIAIAIFVILLISLKLPETNSSIEEKKMIIPLYNRCLGKMIHDRRLLGFAFLVGAVNGILFGYFAEMPFYFTQGLGLPTSSFGIISFFICIPLSLGSYISRKMNELKISSDKIIVVAISIMCLGSLLFFLSSYYGFIKVNNTIPALLQSILWLVIVITCIAMIIPNCLSQALENYGNFAGTAASLFGFIYYIIIAGFTTLMGFMHNGSLIQLPLFMLIVSACMMSVFYFTVKKPKCTHIL